MTQPKPILEAETSRLEQGLLALVVLAAVILCGLDQAWLHPGYSAYDEEGLLDHLQAAAEGGPWLWRPLGGSLHLGLLRAWSTFADGSLPALRSLGALLLALQALLLMLWLKPVLGERAGLWAGMAVSACGASLSLANSLLAPSLLPCVFLAHALGLDRAKRPWQHGLLALSAGLWLADYEGWSFALLALALLWLRQAGRGPGAAQRWGLAAAGLLTGLSLAGVLNFNWAAHMQVRAPMTLGTQPWAQVCANLASLLSGAARLPLSGADGQPWPPLWTWPLLVAGAFCLGRAAARIWIVVLIGCLPIALRDSGAELHRLSLGLLGLSALAGAGAARAWERPSLRPWLLALLLSGALWEGQRWLQRDAVARQRAYGRSQAQLQALRWLERRAPAEGGWKLISGLGPFNDGALRWLAQAVPQSEDGAVAALIPWDYEPALKGLPGVRLVIGEGSNGVILFLPKDLKTRDRLMALQAALAPHHARWLPSFAAQERDSALAALKDRRNADPWLRTVLWERWMHGCMLLNEADPKVMQAAMREPLVSGWVFDAAAAGVEALEPQTAAVLRKRAELADPRRARLAVRQDRY